MALDSHKQQELQTQINSKNCEHLLEKVTEMEESIQEAKTSENTAKSDDSRSSYSPSSAAVIEKKTR